MEGHSGVEWSGVERGRGERERESEVRRGGDGR